MGIRVENSAKKRANRVFSLPSGLPYDPTITMNRTHSLPVSPNGPHTPFEGKSALERHMGRTAQPNRVGTTPRTKTDPSVRPPAADSHRGPGCTAYLLKKRLPRPTGRATARSGRVTGSDDGYPRFRATLPYHATASAPHDRPAPPNASGCASTFRLHLPEGT